MVSRARYRPRYRRRHCPTGVLRGLRPSSSTPTPRVDVRVCTWHLMAMNGVFDEHDEVRHAQHAATPSMGGESSEPTPRADRRSYKICFVRLSSIARRQTTAIRIRIRRLYCCTGCHCWTTCLPIVEAEGTVIYCSFSAQTTSGAS